MALTVRISGDVDLDDARAAATQHAFRLVTDVQRQTFNRATILTPVRTGNLRGHNRMGAVVAGGGTVTGEVFNDANYALMVHDGTAPHIIMAKRRRAVGPRAGGGTRRSRRRGALKFEYRGKMIFRRLVHHPGTAARPWLARAGQEIAAANGFQWERTS